MEDQSQQLRLARYRVLSEVGVLVSEAPDLQRLLGPLMSKVRSVLEFDRCTLALLDGDAQTYQLQTLFEARARVAPVTEAAVPIDRGLPGAVMRSHDLHLITDLQAAREEIVQHHQSKGGSARPGAYGIRGRRGGQWS